MRYLNLQILKKVPKKYDPEKVYDENEIHLARQYNDWEPDGYHVKLKTRSVYASLEDIRDYILSMHPDYDMSCWALGDFGRPSNVHVAEGKDWKVTLSESEMKSLERGHVAEFVYADLVGEWIVDIPYDEADVLQDIAFGVVDRRMLRKCEDAMIQFYLDQSKEQLDEMVSYLDCRSTGWTCIPAMAAMMVYAKKCGCKCYVRVES